MSKREEILAQNLKEVEDNRIGGLERMVIMQRNVEEEIEKLKLQQSRLTQEILEYCIERELYMFLKFDLGKFRRYVNRRR